MLYVTYFGEIDLWLILLTNEYGGSEGGRREEYLGHAGGMPEILYSDSDPNPVLYSSLSPIVAFPPGKLAI